MEIKEKVAHLKGLFEGMEYDASTKEGKLFSNILDVLESISDELESVSEDVETLFDYTDELDSDLGDVESELFGDEDDEDYDDDYEDDEECLSCEHYDDCEGQCIDVGDDEK